MNEFLRIENGKVIDESGQEVYLRGVNLGGWLIQESWMCPVSGEDRKWANLNTLQILEERFEPQAVQTLIDTYQDNWITQEDVKKISELGCNVMRVPFWYRNFMMDEMGRWIEEDFDKNPGFQRLDWIVEMAEKYGMYVILDMHGCPGGQSMDHCCGTLMENRLYTEEQCLQTMENLWIAIAKRYKDCATVAAYDIMNEPQNNSGYEGDNSYDPWEENSWNLSNQVYARMFDAIREVDERHIITVEGIWRVSNLPNPSQMGWDNVMYQTHLYDDDEGFKKWVDAMQETVENYKVAGYIGEFQNMNGISMCNDAGVHWTTWTYKGTNVDVGTFFWYFGEVERVDVKNDSYETIIDKWGEPIRTKNFIEKIEVTDTIKKYARA